MSHTKGKLAANADRIESEKEHGWANDGWIIAKCEGPEAFANTRRLVACWNALDGVPTEAIEARDVQQPVLAREPVGFRWRRGADERWRHNRIDLLCDSFTSKKGIEYELLYTALAPEDDYVGMLEDSKEELKIENEQLLGVLRKVVEWNEKYPSHRIYSHHRIIEIAGEMDVICDEARTAITNHKEA